MVSHNPSNEYTDFIEQEDINSAPQINERRQQDNFQIIRKRNFTSKTPNMIRDEDDLKQNDLE